MWLSRDLLRSPLESIYQSGWRRIPKGQRRLGGLDEMIISLYAGGMTVRDIGTTCTEP